MAPGVRGPGVKGRPQACLTCRRRKKGCDLQRPSCGQCSKACIPCGGYTSKAAPGTNERASTSKATVLTAADVAVLQPRPYSVGRGRFDSRLPPTPVGGLASGPGSGSGSGPSPYATPPSSSSALPLHPRLPSQCQSPPPSPAPADDQLRSCRGPPDTLHPPSSHHHQGLAHHRYMSSGRRHDDKDLRKHVFLQQQYQQYRHGSADICHSGPLARSAQDKCLIDLFWEAYLPNGQPFPPGSFQADFGGSIYAMQSLSLHSYGLHKGLVAMGLATVAKEDGAEWMLKAAMQVYGDALSHASKSFDRQGGWTEEQLVATRLFTFFEAMCGAELRSHRSQYESWLIHGSGEVAMVASRDPSAYIHGRAHGLFVEGRQRLALKAMVTKKRTFLSEPAWKTIPWTVNRKTPRDVFLDIMVDVPSLLEGLDAMTRWESHGEKKDAHAKLLRRAAFSIIERLLDWHGRYATPITPATLDEELPELLVPEELASNHVMSLYWSTAMRMQNIYRLLSSPGDETNEPIDTDDYCTRLVCACRLFAHKSAGLFRTHVSAYPLSTAAQHLRKVGPGRMEAERQSLQRVLSTPECSQINKFITSTEPLQQPRTPF